MEKTVLLNGDALRKLRKSLGLTQEEFGQPVGLSYSFISQLEKGVKGISLANLIKLANCYNKPLEYFTDGSDEQPKKGKLISSVRQNKKIRPDDVAENTGIDILSYYSIENGTLEPTESQLKLICDYLEINEEILNEDIINTLNQALQLLKTILKPSALEAVEKFIYRELRGINR